MSQKCCGNPELLSMLWQVTDLLKNGIAIGKIYYASYSLFSVMK